MSQVACVDALDPRASGVTPWRQALIFLTLLSIWTLFLYRNTGVAMVSIWARSGTFTHAFLVPPIVAWLIWRKRQILALYTPEPNGYVLIGVVSVALMWGIGELASVNAVTQWVLVALLVLQVPAILGMTVARLISFPLFFLFFAVPVGEFLMPPLMEGTAHFTVFALRMSGIPVYREGLQFVIPTGNWSVVEACSGVRYLIASVTVGTLFSYLNFQSIQRRIFFVLVSLVVPVIANWIRAYFIVVLGHISGNKIATGVDHLIYGWLFFGLVIMLTFFIGARWAQADSKTGGIVTPAGVTPFQAARLWFVTVFFALIVSLPHWALYDDEPRQSDTVVSLSAPLALASGWRAMDSRAIAFKPAFKKTSAEINQVYAREGRSVGVYLGYYRHQNYAQKLVSSNNVLVASNDPHWSLVLNDHRGVSLAQQSVDVRSAELRGTTLKEAGSSERLLAWQIYWVDGQLTSSDHMAKLLGVFARLRGRGDDAAVIVIYTPKEQTGDADADATLLSYWRDNYPMLHALLRTAQQSR